MTMRLLSSRTMTLTSAWVPNGSQNHRTDGPWSRRRPPRENQNLLVTLGAIHASNTSAPGLPTRSSARATRSARSMRWRSWPDGGADHKQIALAVPEPRADEAAAPRGFRWLAAANHALDPQPAIRVVNVVHGE